LASFVFLGALEATGQTPDRSSTGTKAPEPPGASLKVYLMTLGQGDAIWERFGHNAIWIRDEATGREAAYNWGMFDFGQVDFVPRLLRGTMLYWMAPLDPRASLDGARSADRPAWIQELALTPHQKMELLEFVQWNARPENAYYRYDYYRDNCSTRVRDALDRVLGGRLKAISDRDTTNHTYRWHTRRVLGDVLWAYAGIQVLMGPRADRPISRWEEAFLPVKLMELVREVTVPGGNGELLPLVVEDRQVIDASRPPEPEAPPFFFPWFLLGGAIWGGGILALARRGPGQGPPGRLGLLVLGGGWALVATLAGTLLLGGWLFTDHVFWHGNRNLFLVNPFFLPLVGAFLRFAFGGPWPRWARQTAAVLGALTGIGLLASFLPGLGQTNGEVLAFALPVTGALVFASFRLSEGNPGGPTAPGPPKPGETGEREDR
jgi:hypothetical protein